jgi:hypothetical protein
MMTRGTAKAQSQAKAMNPPISTQIGNIAADKANGTKHHPKYMKWSCQKEAQHAWNKKKKVNHPERASRMDHPRNLGNQQSTLVGDKCCECPRVKLSATNRCAASGWCLHKNCDTGLKQSYLQENDNVFQKVEQIIPLASFVSDTTKW